MKKTSKKIHKILLVGILIPSLMNACSSTKSLEAAPDRIIQNDSKKQEIQNPSKEQISPNTSEPSDLGNDQPISNLDTKSVGKFNTQDIFKNSFTHNIFKENELTMVNVFATWCTPCIEEMPDLEKLHQQMKSKGVGVVGVILDVLDENQKIVNENLERAQLLVKKTGVSYPILLPDKNYFNGRLIGIEGLPESFFVDKNGNIVGEKYSGSGGLEDWLEIVERELANLKEGA